MKKLQLLLFYIVFLTVVTLFFAPPSTFAVNYAPTISVVSGTNWDDTDNCYAQKKTYTATITYSDADGFADIYYMELWIVTASLTKRASFQFDENQNAWYTPLGSDKWTLTGQSNVSSGNDITIVWGFQAQWDAIAESDLDLYTFVYDAANATGDLLSDQNFDVVTTVTTTPVSNDYRQSTGGFVYISGTIIYTGSTSVILPDTEVSTSGIIVHSSGHASKGTSSSASYSISVTLGSSVASDTYHIYVDGSDSDFSDGDKGSSTSTVVADRIRIDSLASVDGRIDVNTQGTFYATASLEYDSHALGSGDSLVLGGYTFTWDAGDSRFEYSSTQGSVTAISVSTFTSGSEATYGITSGNINSKTATVIWDAVEVYEKDDPIISGNGQASEPIVSDSGFKASDLVYSSDPIVGPMNWYSFVSSLPFPLLCCCLVFVKIPKRRVKTRSLVKILFVLGLVGFVALCSQFSFVPSAKAQISRITFVQGPTNPPIVTSDNINYSLMANGTYQAYFKSNSKTANSVRFQNKGYTFDMDISTSQLHWYNSTYNAIIGMVQEMNPQDTQANASGNTVTYSGAWINTDLVYQAYSDSLKETLIIKNVSAPSSSIKPDYLQYVANCYFNNSLTIYANGISYLHPTNQKFVTNGTIDFNDANNQTVFWLPQPSIQDSNGSSAMGLYAVTANNGILIINMRVSKTFLDQAVFPVYFDPPVRVQGNARGTTSNTNLPVTMASTPGNGNVEVAAITTDGFPGSVVTVSSIVQTGVTWTKQISKSESTYKHNIEIWSGIVGSGASTSIAITLSAGPLGGAVADVCEYSGLSTSGLVDQTASNTGTSLYPDTGTTATTTQADELWIGAVKGDNYAHSTPTNGFTLLDGNVYAGSISLAYLEKIVSGTGTANSGTTLPYTVDMWVGCIVTFKATAGETTPPTYSNIAHNTTVAGNPALFSCQWTDETGLSGHIFSTNNSSVWINETWTILSGSSSWANVSKTLNSTIHITVGFIWYCNDTGNNWALTSITYIYLTSSKSTSVNVNTYVVIWFRLRYKYDSTSYTSASGSTVSINGTLATYDATTNYWWINVTQSVQGNYTYIVSAVSDGVYGLTAISDAVGGVTVEWYQPNEVPTNDSCTALDLSSGNILVKYTYYSFEVNVTDNDGLWNLDYVELRFETSEGVYSAVVRWQESMNTFTVTSGSAYIDEDGSSNATATNTTVLTFKVMFDWDYPFTSDVDVQVYSLDDYLGTDTDVFDLSIPVKNVLTASAFNCDDDRGSTGQTLTFDGSIYYDGTAYSPLDVEITNIIIHDGSHNNQGQNATVSGVFQIQATAKSVHGQTTYHIYIDGAGDYADDDVAGVTDNFIADTLEVLGLSSVRYDGSGTYYYEVQIQYGYDSSAITGAYLNISNPSDTNLCQLSSNSSGWVSFMLNPSNWTSGAFTVYGVNDNNYGVLSSGANQTVTLYSWVLDAQDSEGNSITDESLTVADGGTTVWSGVLNTIYVPSDTFNVSVIWLENLSVNTTLNVVVGSDITSNLTTACYPFTLNSVRYWVASNATINFTSYSSDLLTVQFDIAEDTYILVDSCTAKPTYILDFAYDLDTAFGSYLVLPHWGNQTLEISYAGWGTLYLQSTDQSLVSAAWVGQQLNMIFSGGTGETGNMELYCDGRGMPTETSGFLTATYASSTKLLTGTMTFTSQKTVTILWGEDTGSSPPSGGGPTQSVSNLLVAIELIFSQHYNAGTLSNATLRVKWSGPQTISVYAVTFGENMTWIEVSGLPMKLMKARDMTQGESLIDVLVNVPSSFEGDYTVPCDVLILTDAGQEVTVRGNIEFTIIPLPSTIPQYMTILFLAIIGSMLFVAMLRRRRNA